MAGKMTKASDNKYSYSDWSDSLGAETDYEHLMKPRQIMLEMVLI